MNHALELVWEDAQAVLNGRIGPLEPLRGKSIFLTGGSGFLGAWLLELIRLLNRDHGFGVSVTALSRQAKLFGERYPHLSAADGIQLQDGDVRHLVDLPPATQLVIHAAALTDRRLWASNPSAVAEVNVLGAMRVFRAANLLEYLQKILLLSSGLVAGRQPLDMERMPEDYCGPLRCDDVNSVYAESKRMAEIVGQCAVSEWKAPLVVLRPFAFVGPHQDLDLPWAVTDFIRDAMGGRTIRIMGDGSTVRSLMYAADFAYWTLAALAAGKVRSVYNVGSPEAIDLLSLAKLITRQLPMKIGIKTEVGHTGHETSRLVPSVHRAVGDFAGNAVFSLEKALSRTIEWHRRMRG